MISKRFCFPILLFVLLFYSCNNNFDVLKTSSSKSYNKNIQNGFQLMKGQKYDSAFYYFEKAKLATQNANEKVYSLLQMAAIQQLFCDFSGSEATATEAYQNAKDSLYFPYIYNKLGIAYQEQSNYDEALKYYKKCTNNSLNELEKCMVRNNIAVVYLEKKEFNTAIKILSKDITNISLKKDRKAYARSLDNLGYALFKINNSKAIEFLNQSKLIRVKENDDYEKIASFIHLSEYYQNTNQNVAIDYAQKAYLSATKVNSPDDRLEALKFWIINAEPTEAKKLSIQQMAIADSISKVRQSAKNQFAKIKYDSGKAIKEKEHTEEQKQTISIVLVLVCILSLIIIYLIRYLNQQKLKTAVYDTETRIAKKIHDELANDVFQTMTYAETQDLQNPDKKETLLENLDNIYTRTRNISQSNSEIDTNENYREFVLELLNSYNNEKVNIIINNSNAFNWDKLKRENKIAVYRVLQELMVNMKKHSQSTIVIISFVDQPKNIQIIYNDNGIGAVPSNNNKKGLHNAENRIQAIKGTITFENEIQKGFRVTITIPK